MQNDSTKPAAPAVAQTASPAWRLQSSSGSVGPDVSGVCFVRITNGREVVEGHGDSMLNAKENAFREAQQRAGQ